MDVHETPRHITMNPHRFPVGKPDSEVVSGVPIGLNYMFYGMIQSSFLIEIYENQTQILINCTLNNNGVYA